MKYLRILIVAALSTLFFNAEAQQNNRENKLPETQKSMTGIQAGLLGAWGYYEFSAARLLAVRTEVGFNSGYGGGGVLVLPALTLEPRFYYNLDNRAAKGKTTTNNVGNFVAISHRYNYTGLNYSTNQEFDFAEAHGLSVFARWGMRRNLTKHLNFETSFGLGYGMYSIRNSPHKNTAGSVFDMQVRLGYKF